MSASRHLALAAAALALAALAALWAHILSPSFGGANECEMTYMRPGYLPVPLPSTLANDRGYALFLYREGMSRVSSGDARREVGRLGKPRPDGTRATPAIFLPGNGGSFKQVRSVGSESHRISGERARGRDATRRKNDDSNANANVSNEPIPYLDWFAVSFGEELSAFHGALLEDQIAFAARAIEHVASLYAVQRRTAHGHLPTGESHTGRISSVPTHVAILGHSMGGLVARGALLDARFRVEKKSAPPLAFSLVTLASPHAYSPATTTKGAARTHARMNEAWRVGHAAARGDASLRHVALASVAGGDRDRQVLASHASVVGVVDARFGFEVDAGDVPTARGVSADHQCVVWCNQVIKAVANALIDAVMSHTRDYEADEPPPSEGGAEKRFSEAEASYEATASYDAIATATAARRAALASRLVGDISDTRTTGDENSRRSLVTVRRVLARGALRWTPSLVPATVSAAFALAGAASPRRAARAGEGSSGKRPFFYTRRGTHAWDMCDTQALVFAGAGTLASCLACAWLPAAGAAAGAAARVVLLCRLVNQSRTKKKKDDPSFLARETYRCVAHVVAALATLPSAAAAALCAWHAAGTVGATKARTSVLFASPFLRGGEDAWWALAAAAPAWLGRGTGFVLESATPAAVAPLADALDSAALFAAAAVAAGAAVPGRAHETQTAAALAGVGAAVAALAGRLGFFLVKIIRRRGAGVGKTKTG